MAVVLEMSAWPTGPLETQGRGSMHAHILVSVLGHDLTHRLAVLLGCAASGHVVIEMQRWSNAVQDATFPVFVAQNSAQVLPKMKQPGTLEQSWKGKWM